MSKGPHRAKSRKGEAPAAASEGRRVTPLLAAPRARSEVGNVKGAPPSEVKKRRSACGRKRGPEGSAAFSGAPSAQRGGECQRGPTERSQEKEKRLRPQARAGG